jgi:hypothetical protein
MPHVEESLIVEAADVVPMRVGDLHAEQPAVVVAAGVELLAHRLGSPVGGAEEHRNVRGNCAPKPASIRRSPLGCATRIAVAAKWRLSRNDPPRTAKAARVS